MEGRKEELMGGWEDGRRDGRMEGRKDGDGRIEYRKEVWQGRTERNNTIKDGTMEGRTEGRKEGR
jgi:hypothetical protein